MKDVQINDLQQYIDRNALFIDVRESYEQPRLTFPNQLEIPMSVIGDRLSEIPKEGEVLIYCQSGIRSANVVAALTEHYGYTNLLNVVGGASMISVGLPEVLA